MLQPVMADFFFFLLRQTANKLSAYCTDALRGEQLAISMQQRHLHVAGNLNGEDESYEKYVFSEPWEKGANMHVSQDC